MSLPACLQFFADFLYHLQGLVPLFTQKLEFFACSLYLMQCFIPLFLYALHLGLFFILICTQVLVSHGGNINKRRGVLRNSEMKLPNFRVPLLTGLIYCVLNRFQSILRFMEA